MSSIPVVAAGDPHGAYAPILDFCRRQERSGILVLLGDQDLEEPLSDVLEPLYADLWSVFWLLGNHDCSLDRHYDNLVGSLGQHPDGHLGGRCIEAGGLRVTGLSGIFKGKVWYPREGIEPPRYSTRADYMRQVRPPERWRSATTGPELVELRGMPLRMRDAIFPEDLERVATAGPCDVVVSHEAPSCHRHGFRALDLLADQVGCRLWLHGHHHRSYEDRLTLPSGREMRVIGLGVGECRRIDGEVA